LRIGIIAQYEAELQPNFRTYRVTLPRGEPSLKSALYQLVEREEYLSQGGQAVITVTGVEQLYFLKLGKERSEQEIFFGYLQGSIVHTVLKIDSRPYWAWLSLNY
jgi:hypothetical protein